MIPSPCFVLDEQKIVNNLELIRQVKESASVEIIPALKAFAMWSHIPFIRQYINGAAASSLNEVLLCNEEMQLKAHTCCVAYHPSEINRIIEGSSHVTFNSGEQYRIYNELIPEEVSIGLRVNPEWSDVKTALYNPAHQTSRLGVNHRDLTGLPDRVEGLHFHVLCESDSRALARVLQNFELKFGQYLKKIKWVNLGGGHLITKKGYDLGHLTTLLNAFKEKYSLDLLLEPGSAFVWQAGDLHTTVLDIVENGGVRTAIIDASFTCHMPDCLEMPYRPSVTGAFSFKKPDTHPYRLGGVSCLAGDYLDTYWFEQELKTGDPIIFKDMIHYTIVKTTMFNGVKHPSIGILRRDGTFELIRAFDYPDYRSRWS